MAMGSALQEVPQQAGPQLTLPKALAALHSVKLPARQKLPALWGIEIRARLGSLSCCAGVQEAPLASYARMLPVAALMPSSVATRQAATAPGQAAAKGLAAT